MKEEKNYLGEKQWITVAYFKSTCAWENGKGMWDTGETRQIMMGLKLFIEFCKASVICWRLQIYKSLNVFKKI